MACYHPIRAWRGDFLPSGKRAIVWNARESKLREPIDLPCGQCVGCRLERSRQWAIRCVHEAQMFDKNCFITLTYNKESLPVDNSLEMRDVQLFMKRLRKAYPQSRIRFFLCGEYGEERGRPHYHACLFNFDFPDKQLWTVKNGNRLYVSRSLSEIWGKGHCMIGDVTFESAAYVARYIMKKITGDAADDAYVDMGSGVIKTKEFITMSRGGRGGLGGIGKSWFTVYKGDVYPSDFAVIRGQKMKPPKYYDMLYDILDPDEMKRIKDDRMEHAKSLKADNDSFRLAVKEEVKKSRIRNLVRTLEVVK